MLWNGEEKSVWFGLRCQVLLATVGAALFWTCLLIKGNVRADPPKPWRRALMAPIVRFTHPKSVVLSSFLSLGACCPSQTIPDNPRRVQERIDQ